MSNIFPVSNELYEAVIDDCYEFLYNICTEDAKKSLENLFKTRIESYDADNKIYVLKYYISSPESKKILNQEIIQYTLKYINHMEKDYVDNTFKKLKSIADFCLAYLALTSFRYIYDINFKENKFFFFQTNDYRNFSNFLLKYSILSQIKEAYEKSTISIYNSAVQNKYLSLIKIFDINKIFILEQIIENDKIKTKEPQDTKKKILNSSVNQELKNSSVKISKSANGKKSKTKDESSFKKNNRADDIFRKNKILTPKKLYDSNAKSNNIKESKSKEESKKDKSLINANKNKEKSSDISDLKDEIEKLKIKTLDLDIKCLELGEVLFSESSINAALIKIEKTKSDYLDNLNRKLINTMKNLANPYNFNLWRKVSNMLLKNIFVILKNDKFELRQNLSNGIKNLLISNACKNKIYNTEFKEKIRNYESKYNSSNTNIITQNLSNSADKKRVYNLVAIYKNNSPDITASLSIDFLFYLKEKGNQVNHFDEKVLNFILFNDMNIVEVENKDVKIEEEKTNIIINEDDVLDKVYEGRINFDSNEIISMLKNPLKFMKDDYIDVKILFTPIYKEIEEIKKLVGYNNSGIQIKKLEENVENISLNIKEIISYFENYFQTNDIDFKNIKKELTDDKISLNDKNKLKEYSKIISVSNKIEDKLKFYQQLKDRITNLNSSISQKEIKINKSINKIKDEIKKVAKLISIDDVFKKYKSNLLQIINNDNENEYKQYDKIFNEKNINNFSISQFYHFISTNLNKEKKQLCITKRDITNYNLFIAIIEEFQEFKDDYQGDIDVPIKSNM